MNRTTFCMLAGIIFTLVALFHRVRIYMDWPDDRGLVSSEMG